MKPLLLGVLLAVAGHACRAGDIPGTSTYIGPIQGVGVGFFGHVGIGLPPGQTCHGQTVVVLLTTNARSLQGNSQRPLDRRSGGSVGVSGEG